MLTARLTHRERIAFLEEEHIDYFLEFADVKARKHVLNKGFGLLPIDDKLATIQVRSERMPPTPAAAGHDQPSPWRHSAPREREPATAAAEECGSPRGRS